MTSADNQRDHSTPLVGTMNVGNGGTGIRIDIDQLDDVLRQMVIERLSDRLVAPISGSPPALHDKELTRLRGQIERSHYLSRDSLLKDIKEKSQQHGQIWLLGPPGAGKSYSLARLDVPDLRYVSLKRKSLQQVTAQLVRRQIFKPILSLSDGEALSVLQEEFAAGGVTFVLDDADQSPDIANFIASLEPAGSTVIFAARTPLPHKLSGMASLRVPPLSRGEVEQFLSLAGITLPPGQFEDVYQRSSGNFLYLVCVCAHVVLPLPQEIDEYHQALFDGLAAQAQEAVSFVAMSRDKLRLIDIQELCSSMDRSYLPSEIRQVLTTSRPVLEEYGGYWNVFHSSFTKFVRAKLDRDGLASLYHRRLGELGLRHESMLAAAHHLLAAGDSRADGFLLNAAHTAYTEGDSASAQLFARSCVDNAVAQKDGNAEASARLLLANVLREVGPLNQAIEEAERSIVLWNDIADSQGAIIARVWLNILRLENGDDENAFNEIERLSTETQNRNDELEGMVALNRSFVMLQRQPRIALASAQRALAILTEGDHELGTELALTNVAASYGVLNEYAMQRKFAGSALEAARKNGHARGEAAALNNLASATRHLGDLVEAEEHWRAAIEVCHRHQFIEPRLMNIAGLGNTFKDAGKFDAARAAYMEVLDEARRMKLLHFEGYALELLGRLDNAEKRFEVAFSRLKEAQTLFPSDVERIRKAATTHALGNACDGLGRRAEASSYHSEAGRHYEHLELFADARKCYLDAANSCYAANDSAGGFHHSIAALRCATKAVDGLAAADIFSTLPETIDPADIADAYLQTIKYLCEQESPNVPGELLIGITGFARRLSPEKGKTFIQQIFDIVSLAIASETPRLLTNAFATALEQASGELLNLDWVIAVSERISLRNNRIFFHRTAGGMLGWTVDVGGQNNMVIQIIATDDALVVARIALSLALIFLANSAFLVSLANQFGEIRDNGWRLYVFSQNEFETNVAQQVDTVKTVDARATTVTESNVPRGEQQPPSFLIVHRDYETVADLVQHPNNRALVWTLLIIGRAFVKHATHTTTDELPGLARACRNLCEHVINGTEFEELLARAEAGDDDVRDD